MKTLLAIILFAISSCGPCHAAHFEPAFQMVILPHEGGYQNIRSDNGNWTGCKVGVGVQKGTKYGISACTYPKEDIKALTIERVAVLYKRDWWDAYHLGDIPDARQTVANRILDALVNNGPIAARWAKQANNRANGKRQDIVSTRASLTAADVAEINKTDPARFLLCFLGYRFLRYDNLADKYPQFFNTWIDREVDEVITAVHDRDEALGKELVDVR